MVNDDEFAKACAFDSGLLRRLLRVIDETPHDLPNYLQREVDEVSRLSEAVWARASERSNQHNPRGGPMMTSPLPTRPAVVRRIAEAILEDFQPGEHLPYLTIEAYALDDPFVQTASEVYDEDGVLCDWYDEALVEAYCQAIDTYIERCPE